MDIGTRKQWSKDWTKEGKSVECSQRLLGSGDRHTCWIHKPSEFRMLSIHTKPPAHAGLTSGLCSSLCWRLAGAFWGHNPQHAQGWGKGLPEGIHQRQPRSWQCLPVTLCSWGHSWVGVPALPMRMCTWWGEPSAANGRTSMAREKQGLQVHSLHPSHKIIFILLHIKFWKYLVVNVWPTCPHKGNHIVQKAYAALANTLAAGT